MCTVCGCGEGETRIEGVQQPHHHHPHGEEQHHHHSDEHHHGDRQHDYSQGPAQAAVAGLSQTRMVQIEEDILSKNDRYAMLNRRWFVEQGVLALNLVSSPGSGKTTLLTRTLTDLKADYPLSVIEGDQQTSQDAERIRSTGVDALQINTGKGCHLDAHMVGHAVTSLKPEPESILFIENVGNLVCPAAFDLGEAHKVAILSVTEGEDKPIKYPNMFQAADLMLINKIDLLPYLEFDIDQCVEYARQVNPEMQILQLSATTGEGMELWYQWLKMTLQIRQLGR